MTMSIVDGPEVNWNFEVTRDTIWRNIRDIFNRLNIKVHIFNDRVEIRGRIPTETIDIPQEATHPKKEPIICSARGLGGWIIRGIRSGFPFPYQVRDKFHGNDTSNQLICAFSLI
jgi:hypothetical protein